MAKGRIPATGSQQTLDEILELLPGAKQESLAKNISELITIAKRPVIAGIVLFDPVLQQVSVQGLLNNGAELPIEALEAAFNAGLDRIKTFRAEQALRQRVEQEAAAQTPPPEPPKTE